MRSQEQDSFRNSHTVCSIGKLAEEFVDGSELSLMEGIIWLKLQLGWTLLPMQYCSPLCL